MRILVAIVAACVLVYGTSVPLVAGEPAETPRPIEFTDPLPYGQKPIDYLGREASDPAAALQRRLESGEATLDRHGPNGYLRSLLAALDVPVESQLLVFSKTALNPNLVAPRNPRAVYFNDDVYVGWVPGADSIEVATVDPVKGMMFYTLSQWGEPTLAREDRCLACHAGQTALQVPGALVRSFLTDETGKPTAGYSRVTHETPFDNRGGGWFVTGTHGEQTHCGNLFGPDAAERLKSSPHAAGNATDLSRWLDAKKYESPHSDLVAHLVLQHQAHGQNLLIRAGMEARLGRRSDAEDRLVRYLVFADEAPLTAEVRGTSGFREAFEKRGPVDDDGCSLRTFDLRTRLFKHRMSYLIGSRAFDGLPPEVKRRIDERLAEILAGAEPPVIAGERPSRAWIPYEASERAALLRLVRRVRRDLPAGWGAPRLP